MMRLSTMGMVVASLNDRGESPIANEIAAPWGHTQGTVRFFRASANFLFVFESQGQQYMLRFIDSGERTVSAIQAELDYIHHLAARSVWVAKPVRSLAGSWVETIATAQGEFHAVVFERLEGEQFEPEELAPARIIRWGQALGELHAAAAGYSGTGRPTWKELLDSSAAGLPRDETAARAALDRVRVKLAQVPTEKENFGLIHFDFELDNIIWQAERPGIVDFDDCARGWFAADIAFALRDVFEDRADGVNWENETAQGFLRGYRSARAIDEQELEHIPLLLEFHNLFSFVRLFHSLGEQEPSGEAEWLTELRKKLIHKIEFYREGFESLKLCLR